jgi:polysaccharide deacetylase family protein (PEP-CTERM system associated)
MSQSPDCNNQSPSVIHALTVDVEDWYHVCTTGEQTIAPRETWRVAGNIEKIVALLEHCQCRATFFILGSVAASIPDLAPMIAAKGHEIASHGWSHKLVSDLTPDQFKAELIQTSELLKFQTGQQPLGYRAPRWSLCQKKTPWAFEILAELGYCYDSSLTPLAAIGDPGGPLHPHQIQTTHGSLWEIPPLVTVTPLGNLPTGGGWGFRFFPSFLIKQTLQQYTAASQPGVLFVHPREFDPNGPRLNVGLFQNFLAYGSRQSSEERLMKLLAFFHFSTLHDVVTTLSVAG